MQYVVREGRLVAVAASTPTPEVPQQAPLPNSGSQNPLAVQLGEALQFGLSPMDPSLRSSDLELAGALQDLGLRPSPCFAGDANEVAVPLREARRRMASYLQTVDSATRRRLFRAWQVGACPPVVQKHLHRYLALTFLPAPARTRFKPHPALVRASQLYQQPVERLLELGSAVDPLLPCTAIADLVASVGHAWAELSEARAMVLVVTPTESGILQWSLRALSFWLDADTGVLRVGGVENLTDGSIRNHLELMLPFGTGPDTPQRAEKYWTAATVQAGLDLAYGLELGITSREGLVDSFLWPRPWVGFVRSDGFRIEFTEALLRDAVRWLRVWQARGRPADYSPVLADPKYGGPLTEPIDAWADVVLALGEVKARQLAESVWADTMVSLDGLSYVPLDYFQPGSPQRPVLSGRSARVVLQFPSELVGREMLDRDLESIFDPLQARVQVMPLRRGQPLRDAVVGSSPSVRYDFRTPARQF